MLKIYDFVEALTLCSHEVDDQSFTSNPAISLMRGVAYNVTKRHSGAVTWAIVERQTTSSIPSTSTCSVPFFCNSFWQFMPRPPSKRRQDKIYQGRPWVAIRPDDEDFVSHEIGRSAT